MISLNDFMKKKIYRSNLDEPLNLEPSSPKVKWQNEEVWKRLRGEISHLIRPRESIWRSSYQ